MSYKEYKQLNMTQIGEEIRKFWEENETFEKGQQLAEGHPSFVFYDGPPSANGKPGIHHVMARTIKDVFCRYKAQKGYFVDRKAGWDTHGLPVELGVEKKLGITKEDIGKKISVDEYNQACRTEVLQYKDLWDELTKQMGYWVDLKHPYITFENEYIETLWFLLKMLYDKGLLYKGYTIQPFSPAAGTGLSSHELNLPGCYRDVKDTTCVAMFRILSKLSEYSEFSELSELPEMPTYAIAWTTTPWTLPSNTALCVGPAIDYVLVETTHPYNGEACRIIMAKALFGNFFTEGEPEEKSKLLHGRIIKECKGTALEGIAYEQLIPWVKPTVVNAAEQTHRTAEKNEAFRIILGDYVTTEDGTGIVHIAPTFGADDARVAKKGGIADLLMYDTDGKQAPMVDRTGKFWKVEDLDPAWAKDNVNLELYNQYAGKFVKNAYDPAKTEKDMSLDVELVVMLKEQGKLFRSEKHTHSYPHCWRTDKPVLYYPLDSWFIRTTAMRDRMIALNKTINWKPEATGSGRFGNWLENIVDWNLSRSRYWGTPLPIWRTEDGKEEICIGSVEELRKEIDKAVAAGMMESNPYREEKYDLHRPYIDNVVLVSPTGRRMMREPDLIDVWFDSGAMPYAQIHYMGEPLKESQFPADFIAEGVDQTRGWFYTLHAIATMCFNSVAFKNVISNGLVLDKNGNKMSKRLGNGVDPFETLKKEGPDATRWYMITNSQPWDNLKFDIEGVDEVRRKLFGTLYNTYSFFALYANIDGFEYKEADIPFGDRPEIDRWILSELNTLVKNVDDAFADYEPTKAGRAIQEFVDANLSNWYVRLSRRRFWKGDMTADKVSAYQTLYTCLETLARLMSPIAPFFSERMFQDLNNVTRRIAAESVHHVAFPEVHEEMIDKALEERMQLAQQICSMGLSLRKKSNLRVRQPLAKIMLPVQSENFRQQVERVQHLICSELNIKEIEFLAPDNDILVKRIKPNFKTLGPRYGKIMKAISAQIQNFTQQEINALEAAGRCDLSVEGQPVEILLSDVEIATQDIPGWVVANDGSLTVALDIVVSDELKAEGIARELVNRIQNIRKEGFDVTDRITIDLQSGEWDEAVKQHMDYICAETLCTKLDLVSQVADGTEIEIIEGQPTRIRITKVMVDSSHNMDSDNIHFVKKATSNNQYYYEMKLRPLQVLQKDMDAYDKKRDNETKNRFFNSYLSYIDWVIAYIDSNTNMNRIFNYDEVISVLFARRDVSEKKLARQLSFYLYACRLYLSRLKEYADIKAADNYPRSIWLMMADTEELIAVNEFLVKKNVLSYPQCTMKTRPEINTLDLKYAANELTYLNCLSDFSKLDYRDIQPCSIMIIRQAIEFLGRNIIGYSSITKPNGNLVKNMTQISWKFLNDYKGKNTLWSVSTPIELKNIELVNKWANEYVHNPWINKTYIRAYGQEVLCELMRPPVDSVKCVDGRIHTNTMFGDFRITNYNALKKDFEKYVKQHNKNCIINWMPIDNVGAYIIS